MKVVTMRFLRVFPEVQPQPVAAEHPERSSRVVPATQPKDASTAPFGFTPRTNAGFRSGCSRVFRTDVHAVRGATADENVEPDAIRLYNPAIFRMDERGQGALEFLLAFPLVVTVLLGIMELSIAVFSYSTIANAAQEGARYGALYPAAVSGTCANPGAGIGDAVCRLTAGLQSGQVRYTVAVENGILRVAVTYRYQAVSGPMGRAVGPGGMLDLSAAAATLIE